MIDTPMNSLLDPTRQVEARSPRIRATGAVNLLRGPEVAPLKAGENRDLGDVVAIVPGESE